MMTTPEPKDMFRLVRDSLNILAGMRAHVDDDVASRIDVQILEDIHAIAGLRRAHFGDAPPPQKKAPKPRNMVLIPTTPVIQKIESIAHLTIDEKRRLLVPRHATQDSLTPCRVLWVKSIIRAAYDYALWKDASDLKLRKFAMDAAKWLFEPSSLFNGFENLCFFFRLPMKELREWARNLTRDQVKKFEFLERTGKDPISLALHSNLETTDGDSQ